MRAASARRRTEERGTTAVEYGLVVALIGVVVLGAALLLGGRLGGVFSAAGSQAGTTTPSQPGDVVVAAGATRTLTGPELQRILGTDPAYSRFWVRWVSAPAEAGVATRPTAVTVRYEAPTTPGTYPVTVSYSHALAPGERAVVDERVIMMEVR